MVIAAYDFGTTGCKASFFTIDGDLISTTYQGYLSHFPQPGWVEQNPTDWKRAFASTTAELLDRSHVQPADIVCISFSGHMMGCVPVDQTGEPLSDRAMLWADNRSRRQADRLVERIGWKTFYLVTGGGLDVVTYPAAKIPWIRENQPDLYRDTAKFLGTKDVICAWLTGTIATDCSDASNTGLLDLRSLVWKQEFLETLGIDRDKMPEVLPSASVMGKLTREAAQAVGLLEGTPVVLGGGDVACGTAGAAAIAENVPYMCIGSAAWVSVATKEPIIDLFARPMTVAHVVPDLYTSQIIMFSAGAAYKWVRDEVFGRPSVEDAGPESFDQVDRLASKAPVGSRGVLFLPYLRPGGAPYYDLNARGAFLGLSLTVKKADLIRAALEGVAFNVRIMLQHLEGERRFETIRIIGGGSRSDLWRQIFADVLNKKVLTLSAQQEANTLGSALVGGVAIGVFEDFSAVDRFTRVTTATSSRSDATAVYEELFQVFRKSYEGLKETNRTLNLTRACIADPEHPWEAKG